MADVTANDVASCIFFEASLVFCVASKRNATGCRSAVYFSSSRLMVISPRVPVELITHSEPDRAMLTCSRPTSAPRMKIVNVAAPGVSCGAAAVWAPAGTQNESATPAAVQYLSTCIPSGYQHAAHDFT